VVVDPDDRAALLRSRRPRAQPTRRPPGAGALDRKVSEVDQAACRACCPPWRRCDSATLPMLAFSCKGRGVCPSCNALRMAQTASHLVDQVFPPLPVRQWVLSVPNRLRWYLEREPKAVTAVLQLPRAPTALWLKFLSRVPIPPVI
jgi:hypothetical protein